jgi:hypothetical protein
LFILKLILLLSPQPTSTMETPHSDLRPGLPLYTFRLGSRAGQRPPAHQVAAVAAAFTPSFSLAASEGWFRGEADPGWALTVAHDDHETMARLAEALRANFAQEGVGIEAFGRYLRCRADHGPELLASELWGLRYGFYPAYLLTRFVVETPPKNVPDRYALITGYATTGESWTEAQNHAADARLRLELVERGLWHHRITGVSPDGLQSEAGWMVGLDLAAARRLGADFHQDAIYWIEAGDHLSVHDCQSLRKAPVGRFTYTVGE